MTNILDSVKKYNDIIDYIKITNNSQVEETYLKRLI